MSDTIITKVVEQLQSMPDNLQREVLRFSQQLKDSQAEGVSGDQLLDFAGAISTDDLEIMQQVIHLETTNVDLDEW